MKTFKTLIAIALCVLTVPAFAGEGDDKDEKKEIRKEKKHFTKKVRSMREAKNYKPSSKDDLAFGIAKGKF